MKVRDESRYERCSQVDDVDHKQGLRKATTIDPNSEKGESGLFEWMASPTCDRLLGNNQDRLDFTTPLPHKNHSE